MYLRSGVLINGRKTAGNTKLVALLVFMTFAALVPTNFVHAQRSLPSTATRIQQLAPLATFKCPTPTTTSAGCDSARQLARAGDLLLYAVIRNLNFPQPAEVDTWLVFYDDRGRATFFVLSLTDIPKAAKGLLMVTYFVDGKVYSEWDKSLQSLSSAETEVQLDSITSFRLTSSTWAFSRTFNEHGQEMTHSIVINTNTGDANDYISDKGEPKPQQTRVYTVHYTNLTWAKKN